MTKPKRKYGSPNPTAAEIAAAVQAFCEVAESDKKFFPRHRGAIRLMAVETERSRIPRRRLGRVLVNRYRRDTGDMRTVKPGGAMWEKFRAWIKEYAGEINFARLIVSILLLVLMF